MINKYDDGSLEKWFDSLVDEREPSYILESVLCDIAEKIFDRMQELNISRSDLARKMKKKPSHITRCLKGYNNMTLRTAIEIGVALDMEFKIGYTPFENEMKEGYTDYKAEFSEKSNFEKINKIVDKKDKMRPEFFADKKNLNAIPFDNQENSLPEAA